jgi:hypothetical protein
MTKTVKITRIKKGINVINNDYPESVGVNLEINYNNLLIVRVGKLTINAEIMERLHSVSVGIGKVDRIQMILENTEKETLKIEYTIKY